MIPDAVPIVATAEFVLLQKPPGVGLLNADGMPGQRLNKPEMAIGNGCTVSIVVVVHPVETV
jgi:hypothetical protein